MLGPLTNLFRKEEWLTVTKTQQLNIVVLIATTKHKYKPTKAYTVKFYHSVCNCKLYSTWSGKLQHNVINYDNKIFLLLL